MKNGVVLLMLSGQIFQSEGMIQDCKEARGSIRLN